MPTTTLNVMLPELARYLGAFIGSFATTTNIAANTSVISTALRDAGFDADDMLNDSFIRILGVANDGVVRRVSDYTGATGTITVTGTNLTAETAARTFELYRYDPLMLRDTLNDARQQAFPALHRRIVDRTQFSVARQTRYTRPTVILPLSVRQVWLEPRIAAKTFADNIAGTLDVDMEASGTADWTAANATISKEADTTSPDNFVVFADNQALKVVVNASAVAQVYLAVPNPTNYDGEEINVGVWVYSRTASRVSAAARFDSGAWTAGTAHSGAGWEYLSVSLAVGDIATSLHVGLQVSSGTAFTFYADELIAVAGPSEVPSPNSIPVPVWNEEGDFIVFAPAVDRWAVLLIGMGLLSSVTVGADTMEIDGSAARLLYAYAAALWLQQDIDQVSDVDQTAALRRFTHFKNRIEEAVGAMSPMPLMRRAV